MTSTSTTTRSSGPAPETIARNEQIRDLVAEGVAATVAIEQVANEHDLTAGSVQTAYYNWRRRQIAAGVEMPKPRRPEVAAAPAPQSEPRAEAFGPKNVSAQRGVSAVGAEEADPLQQVDFSSSRISALLCDHWEALQHARKLLDESRAALELQMLQAASELTRIEEHQTKIKQAALALAVELPPQPDHTAGRDAEND